MKLIIITLLTTFAVVHGWSQNAFYHQFTNEGYDFGQGAVQLPDSSFIITGSSSSFSTGNSEAFLLKIDKNGNKLWSKNYGGPESDWGVRVLHAPNDGLYAYGYSNSFQAEGYDIYAFKTDLNGVLQWERTYPKPGWDRIYDAKITPDNGAIVVGSCDQDGTSGEDFFLMRTDANGDTLWTKTIGGNGKDIATCVEVYHDSLYIIGGKRFIDDSLKTKISLMMLDDTGTILWEDTIGSNGNYTLNDIVIVGDTLQGVGGHWLDENDESDRLGFNVDLTTFQTFGMNNSFNAGNFESYMITNYGDNTSRYIAYGIIASYTNPFGEDLHFGRFTWYTSWQGQVVQIINDYPDIGGEFIPTLDGGALAVGYTSGGNNGGSNVFVLKIGPNETYPIIDNMNTFGLVGTEELSLHENFGLYPNPAQETITIAPGETDRPFSAAITDLTGRAFLEIELTGKTELDVTHLPPGIYLVSLCQEGVQTGSRMLIID